MFISFNNYCTIFNIPYTHCNKHTLVLCSVIADYIVNHFSNYEQLHRDSYPQLASKVVDNLASKDVNNPKNEDNILIQWRVMGVKKTFSKQRSYMSSIRGKSLWSFVDRSNENVSSEAASHQLHWYRPGGYQGGLLQIYQNVLQISHLNYIFKYRNITLISNTFDTFEIFIYLLWSLWTINFRPWRVV